MKSMTGRRTAPKVKEIVSVAEALHYAMSLPVATTASGMNSLEMLRQNIETARGFIPMTQDEMQALRACFMPYAADGRFELYKTSIVHKGPPGRAQHGFPSGEEIAA